MLFDTFKDQELIWQSTVNGATSDGRHAFRGDLTIVLGDMHESGTRNQPKTIFSNATILADGDEFVFVGGALDSVEDIPALFERYGDNIAKGKKVILYIVDADKQMTVEYEGRELCISPYEENLVWQLLMEDLYVEKSDLKGQSAEDKLITMFEAYGDYNPKYPTVSFEDAVAARVADAKRENFGAV